MEEEEKRPYWMVAQAEATAATAERILDIFVALFWERLSDQMARDEVAARAGLLGTLVVQAQDADPAVTALVAAVPAYADVPTVNGTHGQSRAVADASERMRSE